MSCGGWNAVARAMLLRMGQNHGWPMPGRRRLFDCCKICLSFQYDACSRLPCAVDRTALPRRTHPPRTKNANPIEGLAFCIPEVIHSHDRKAHFGPPLKTYSASVSYVLLPDRQLVRSTEQLQGKVALLVTHPGRSWKQRARSLQQQPVRSNSPNPPGR